MNIITEDGSSILLSNNTGNPTLTCGIHGNIFGGQNITAIERIDEALNEVKAHDIFPAEIHLGSVIHREFLKELNDLVLFKNKHTTLSIQWYKGALIKGNAILSSTGAYVVEGDSNGIKIVGIINN